MLRNTILTAALAATVVAISAYAQGTPAPSSSASPHAHQHPAAMAGMGNMMSHMASSKTDKTMCTCPMAKSAGASKPAAPKPQKTDHAAHHPGAGE